MFFSAMRILIWISVVCYFLQSMYHPVFDLSYGLSYIGNDNFKLTQFLTYAFLHGDPFHLIINLFMLVVFGTKIEMLFGKKQFILLFFSGVLGGAIFQSIYNMVIIYNHFGTPFPLDTTNDIIGNAFFVIENGTYIKSVFSNLTIGASAGVFGCMIAFTMLFPKDKFNFIFIPISMSARWFVVIYFILEVFQIIFVQNTQIAHMAHIGGVVFGALYAHFLKTKYNI